MDKPNREDGRAWYWTQVRSQTSSTVTNNPRQQQPKQRTAGSRLAFFPGSAGKPKTGNPPASQAKRRKVDEDSSSVSENDHDAQGDLRARGRKCFSRFKNAVCLTLLFVWTVLFTVKAVTVAAVSFLIPNKLRKLRDIGNDVVLVTNAGRGLGRRLAIVLALRAALVVCWDPDNDRHMNTVYDIRHRGGRAVGFTVDVTDETAVKNAAEILKREVRFPDLLVMSVGRRVQCPLLSWDPKDLEKMYHANVSPHLTLLRTFLPEMQIRNYGHLVCIIAASASVPCYEDTAYAATKLGVAALMCGLADKLDTHPDNKIRLTCVYPSLTEGRPPLAGMAEIVVDQVLRGRRSVIVPRCPLFWMYLMQTLPASARRKWQYFLSRLPGTRGNEASFKEASSPWGEIRRHDDASAQSQTPCGEGFFKFAPYEMASTSSFDSLPLVLKKRGSDDYIEDNDDDEL